MTEDRFGIVGRVVASAYQVESVVAEGGFGVVYRAHHGGFRAPVALKCLKVPQQLDRDQKTRFLEHFRAEAEVMFRLSASVPTVVRPLHVDVMTAPNGSFVPFLVLEWLEGETLDAIICGRARAGKRPLDLGELIVLLEPVARALERAHHFTGPQGAETIVHCDLKPENVFVAQVAGEQQVKILDFGVAEVQRAATSHGAEPGAPAFFTPAYGAPEHWNPRELGPTGPYTDVWGLALTLAESLAGRHVISGDHQQLRRTILDPARRPTPRSNGVVTSDAVEAVFQRALAVRPADRYADAGVFWRALVAAHAHRASPAAVGSPEIPDLVPISRRPSGTHKLELGMNQIDFDDGGDRGPSLALDVRPEELLRTGSLAPIPVAMPGDMGVPSSLGGATVPLSVPPGLARRTPVPPAPFDAKADRFSPVPGEVARRSSRPPIPQAKVEEPPRSLARRLAPGLAIAAGSIVVSLLDRVYAAVTSEVFTLGPLKAGTIAAVLLLGGIGLAARELFRET